jgi:hypothetical protein
VVAFPYAVKHLHWYEQTTLPLAFTLAAAGWLLITLRRPSLINWLGLAWIGALLGTSYTPALGSWSLLLATLAWLGWRALKEGDRSGAVIRLAVAAMVAGCGGLSFLTRVDLMKEPGQTMRPEPLGALVDAFSIFFLGRPEVFIPAVLVLPILIPLALGLIGRLGLPALVASWWAIGIVFVSIGLAGYAVHSVDFEMHRAQVVIPVLLLMAGWAVLRLRAVGSSSTRARVVFALICVLVFGQAAWTVTDSYRSFRPTLRDLAFSELFGRRGAHGASSDDLVAVLLLTDRHEFGNVGDYLRYFHPRHAVVRSVEEVESVAAETATVMLVADAGRTDLPLWIEPGALRRFSRDDPYDAHSIVVWSGSPPPPGAAR